MADVAPSSITTPEAHYKFNIKMTCGGCSGAIERTLGKLEGVKSYNVSLETQTADIVAEPSLEYSTLLEKLKKTGKTIEGGEKDGVVMDV